MWDEGVEKAGVFRKRVGLKERKKMPLSDGHESAPGILYSNG